MDLGGGGQDGTVDLGGTNLARPCGWFEPPQLYHVNGSTTEIEIKQFINLLRQYSKQKTIWNEVGSKARLYYSYNYNRDNQTWICYGY